MPVPAKHRDTLLRLLTSGLTPDEVAARTGLRVNTVKVYATMLRAEGHDIPRRRKWTPERLEQLAEEVATKSYREAGEPYGISSPRVSRLMREYTERWVDRARDGR